ncbi:hypothetical protein [Synechococcus sp. H65.1]|uniref:hypothetical protein n=1 Tax=unclassified Synechococcus TaxID=2626047 RepID=UPI0039C39955
MADPLLKSPNLVLKASKALCSGKQTSVTPASNNEGKHKEFDGAKSYEAGSYKLPASAFIYRLEFRCFLLFLLSFLPFIFHLLSACSGYIRLRSSLPATAAFAKTDGARTITETQTDSDGYEMTYHYVTLTTPQGAIIAWEAYSEAEAQQLAEKMQSFLMSAESQNLGGQR